MTRLPPSAPPGPEAALMPDPGPGEVPAVAATLSPALPEFVEPPFWQTPIPAMETSGQRPQNSTSAGPPRLYPPLPVGPHVIPRKYASRPDLRDQPSPDPDFVLYTNGTSLVKRGQQLSGYVVVMEEFIVGASFLPSHWSTQQAELHALIQALQLSKGQNLKTTLLTGQCCLSAQTETTRDSGKRHTAL
nr:uncharacterized protein LOC110123760 isoform X2 [Odocoileus virginianus texanus]